MKVSMNTFFFCPEKKLTFWVIFKHFVLYSIWIVKSFQHFWLRECWWRYSILSTSWLNDPLFNKMVLDFFREISPRNHGTRFSLVESLAIKSFLLLHHVEIKSEVVKNQTLLFNPLPSSSSKHEIELWLLMHTH